MSYDGSGQYTVTFGWVGSPGGIVNLNVFGTKNRVCNVLSWGSVFTAITYYDEPVYIRCFRDDGTPARSKFTIAYLSTNITSGKLAYVWAGDWTQSDYTPDTTWNFNSSGSPNTVHRSGRGRYTVTLPGMANTKGNVQLGDYARYDPNPPTADVERTPTECTADGTQDNGADLWVYVRCRGLDGPFIDTQFNLTFTNKVGLEGLGGSRVAYLFAGRFTNNPYTPGFKYLDPSGVPTVYHDGLGRYHVTIPNMRKGGAAFVTAFGQGRRRCNITSIGTNSTFQVIGVRCRDFDSQPVDNLFYLSYVR